MKVCEIFKSIEGEGIRTGLPAVFVRLHGCNLRCSYCDSMYAVEGSDYKTMDLQQVLEAVKGYGVKNVTLTGGEPLLHQGVAELLETLSREGFRVNVETNGTVPAKWRLPGLFYTMDWKCKSSAMSSHMKLENMAMSSSAWSGASRTWKKRNPWWIASLPKNPPRLYRKIYPMGFRKGCPLFSCRPYSENFRMWKS